MKRLLLIMLAFYQTVLFAETFGSMGDRASQGQDPRPFGQIPQEPTRNKMALSGRCTIVHKESGAIQTPCPAIQLRLEHDNGKLIATTTVTGGLYEFANVPENTQLFVRVVSSKYDTHKRFGPAKRGETLEVFAQKNWKQLERKR